MPPGRLTNRPVFQAMYDSLATGKAISLSKKQRAWAEGVYKENKLDKRSFPLKQKVEVKDKGPSKILDFGPLPMKPPGRK